MFFCQKIKLEVKDASSGAALIQFGHPEEAQVRVAGEANACMSEVLYADYTDFAECAVVVVY